MTKENYMNDLNSIKNMIGQINTLTESIMFNEGYDDEEEMPEEEFGGQAPLSKMGGREEDAELMQQPQGPQDEKDAEQMGMSKLDDMGALDQIREITLKGMIKLCKNPEDGEYQALKKIFQMCDKAVQDKGEEGQQQQQARPMR